MPQLVALIGEPRARLFDDVGLQRHIKHGTFLGDALAVQHIEFGGLERRSHLVLNNLDLGTVADSLITVLNGLDTADVHTYGRVELQCLAAGGGLRITEEHANFLTQLVDEDGGGTGLRQRTGHLTQRLTHQARLQADMAVSHLAFDFRFRHQGRDGIDDNHAGTNQHVGDFQCLLAIVRLRDDQRIGVDAQLTGIDRIERMLGIDECGHTAGLLGIGHHMQRQCGLTRGFRSVNLHNTAFRQAADA